MQEMWDKLYTTEMVLWMKGITGETEDFDTIAGFIDHMKNRVDYKQVVVMAMNWHTYDESKQVSLAILNGGMFHASRFMLMMDYLSKKFLKGELK
jgi:hypothetical protein